MALSFLSAQQSESVRPGGGIEDRERRPLVSTHLRTAARNEILLDELAAGQQHVA